MLRRVNGTNAGESGRENGAAAGPPNVWPSVWEMGPSPGCR